MPTLHRPHRARPASAEAEPAPAPLPARSVPVKVTLDVRIEGAAGTVEFTVLPEQLPDQLAQLARRGVTPRVGFDTTAEGHPICPKHRVPMRRREKQGDEWYSHKVVDAQGVEHYCRGYRGPESPGYDVKAG
jgi:hypothetical protein